MRRALAIVLLLLLLDRAAGIVLGQLYERTYSGEGGGLLNYAIEQRVDLLVLGSSRAKHHVDPRILSRNLSLSAYNAGINGQDFLYAALLMELRQQAGVPAPKVLVLHVDPTSFAKKSGELERLAVFSHFVPTNDAVREFMYARSRFEWLKYLSWAYRYNGKVLSIIKNVGRKPSSHTGGFAPLSGTLANEAPLQLEATGNPTAPYWPAKLDLFARLMASCQKTNTKVYVINTPTAEDSAETHERWFKKLQATLPSAQQVTFLDLSQYTHPEFRDRTLFRDPAHLNGRGAQMLTEALSGELGKSRESWRGFQRVRIE